MKPKTVFLFAWPFALALVLSVMFLALGLACGTEPNKPIDAPDEIDLADDPGVLATATFEAAQYGWTIIPERRVFTLTDKRLYFAAGSKWPSYTLAVSGVDKAGKLVGPYLHVVTVKTPEPPVPPVPPVPPPPPGRLKAVVIEEQSERTAEQAVVLGSAKVRGAFSMFRVADKDETGPDDKPPPDLAPYLDIAKGKPLPYLILVYENGQGYWHGPLPKTVDDVLKLLKEPTR